MIFHFGYIPTLKKSSTQYIEKNKGGVWSCDSNCCLLYTSDAADE